VKKLVIFIITILTFATPIFAHENWITVDNFYPNPGDTITVTLSGGHHFPENDVLVKESLIYKPEVIFPDGSVETLSLTADKNRWIARLPISQSGVYLVKSALKRPQMDTPLFYGKAIVISGSKDNPEGYGTGAPVDIVPIHPVSSLSPGENLTLTLLKNHQADSGTITLMPEEGKNNYLTTTKNQPAEYKLRNSGSCLATVSSGGINCSVTFAIQPQ